MAQLEGWCAATLQGRWCFLRESGVDPFAQKLRVNRRTPRMISVRYAMRRVRLATVCLMRHA